MNDLNKEQRMLPEDDPVFRPLKRSPILPHPEQFTDQVMSEILRPESHASRSFIDLFFIPAEIPVVRRVLAIAVIALASASLFQLVESSIARYQIDARYGAQRDQIAVARIAYSVDLTRIPLDKNERSTLASLGVSAQQRLGPAVLDDLPPMVRTTIEQLLPRYHRSLEQILHHVKTELVFGRAG
jgi:hypothetical protein